MKSIPERREIQEQDTWDLRLLYAEEADWQLEFRKLEEGLPKIAAFRGTLGSGVEKLLGGLSLYFEQFRLVEKLYTYAHLQSDQDTRDAGSIGRVDRARNIYARLSAEWSFLTPEILSIPDAEMDTLIESTQMKPYRRVLEEMLRYKPHTLSSVEENLLAMASEALSASERIFGQLNNADLSFGSVLVGGQEQELSHGSYQVLMKNRDRAVRKATFENYYEAYDQHKNTIATTLTTSVQRASFLARARKHGGARAQALFSEHMPAAVYDNLVETVSQNLAPLYRYYELRKKVLGLSELCSYDLAVPLVKDVEKVTPYEEAAELVLTSLKPLGEEYTTVLRKGLLSGRWVDRFENKGKRSGAYSSGCYDSPPYLLMNYHQESLHDVFTLAHEAGHSMHSYYSVKNQPYQDHGYGIFVAEVASTFNEQLLAAHLEEVSKDNKPLVAYLVNEQIEDIRSTLIRQTMFAEFERDIHARAERNEPLTIAEYRDIYSGLLAKYFGPGVTLQPQNELEFLRIPHFYSAFYVYKYATGVSAAIALSDMVQAGGDREREQYLSFLKAGGSKYPLDVLRDAGVDMTSPVPVERALQKFDRLVGRLESLLLS